MENLTDLGLGKTTNNELAQKLNELLTNYHIYYQNLRAFHWNIKGPNFFSLHAKFEELYTVALTKIDEIAERILTIGHIPLHTFSDYVRISSIQECQNLSGDRETVSWQLAIVSPRFGPRGSFAGYISSCIDITELKEFEEALQSRNAELERSNNDLDNFIYTASHDLKTPILNIEGLVELLRGDLPADVLQNPDIAISLQLIRKAISRFRNTIADLTELSKLQRQAEDIDQINVSAFFDEICLDLALPIKASQAILKPDFSRAPSIQFSKKNFRSILYNLVSNAVKYHSPIRTPIINITTAIESDTFILTVADNGIGINMAQADKLFMMYKRLHDHVEGNGLGLYIVKKIIENTQGKITVTSEVDKGTTFQVILKTQEH